MADALDDLSEIEALARAAMADARVTSIAHASAQLHAHMSPARTLRLIERLREAEREASNLCEHLTAAHEVAVAAESRATAAEARVVELEGVVREIAEGLTPPVPEGHYLAHRAAVRAARAALTTEGRGDG